MEATNQLIDIQLARTDPFQGGDPSHQDMIEPTVGARQLERCDITWLFHNQDLACISLRIAADRARIAFRNMPALRADEQRPFKLADGMGKLERLALGLLQQVKAMRSADRLPIPGRRANWSTSRVRTEGEAAGFIELL